MQNGTAPPGKRPQGPAMTIRVYTVDRYGTVISDRGTRLVAYSEKLQLPKTLKYPPCQCPRCRTAVAR